MLLITYFTTYRALISTFVLSLGWYPRPGPNLFNRLKYNGYIGMNISDNYVGIFVSTRFLCWHLPQIFVTSSTYGREFSKVSFVRHQKPPEIRILKKLKTLGKTSRSLECPIVFKILNISIFGGDWNHTKLTFNFIKFYHFSNVELYCLWNSDGIMEWISPWTIKMIPAE